MPANKSAFFFPATIVLMVGIFVLDLRTPRGVVVWTLYAVPIGLACSWARPRSVFLVTLAATLLIFVGFCLSPPGIAPAIALLNRCLGTGMLWFIAVVLVKQHFNRALQRERDLSNSILNSVPGILYFYDSDGRFLGWNRNFETVSGYSGDEVRRMHPLDFFTGEDRARVEQRILEVFGKNESSVEAAFVAKDGTSTPYFFTGRRVSFEGKSCLVGMGIDVSDRKRTETALREAELRFHTLFEQTPVGVVVIDPAAASIIECNEQAARQLGYTSGEFCQLSISHIEAIETREDVERHIERVLREGRDQFETKHRTRSGEIRDVYVSARLLHLTGRTAINCVFLDVTERNRAEAKVRESEARYRTLFEYAPDGIVIADPESYYLDANPSMCRMLDYTREEFIGLHASDIIHETEIPEIAPTLNAINRQADHHRDWRFRRKNGAVFPVEVIATRMPDGNILGMIRDVTDRKEAEAEREKRQQAEAADRIKSAFLANMSHELRTPLNSIIGFTGIILQGLAGPLNPEQTKQLGMVRTSARHLLALVNDVLDISKIEAGQFEVAREPFDLQRSITRVVAVIAPLAEKKGLPLQVQIAANLGQAVSDQRRFEQILLNLLSNAIKFTDRGEIRLRAERIDGFQPPGATLGQVAVRVTISDTGIGIKPDDLANLFQPFRQIHSGLSRNHDGTGLGLAICRRLADLMGGTIGAESTWEKGSTFSVTLPLGGSPRP